jgi:hypothetical protein
MIRWPWLIGSAAAGAITALVALAIAVLSGGAVSPLAGLALGLAFGMMASRLVPGRQAVLLGLVAAVSAVLTILLAQS